MLFNHTLNNHELSLSWGSPPKSPAQPLRSPDYETLGPQRATISPNILWSGLHSYCVEDLQLMAYYPATGRKNFHWNNLYIPVLQYETNTPLNTQDKLECGTGK